MTGWDEMYTYGYGDSLYKFIYGWVAGFGIWYSEVGEEHWSIGVFVTVRRQVGKRQGIKTVRFITTVFCYGNGRRE
jgi:hypothetical protein